MAGLGRGAVVGTAARIGVVVVVGGTVVGAVDVVVVVSTMVVEVVEVVEVEVDEGASVDGGAVASTVVASRPHPITHKATMATASAALMVFMNLSLAGIDKADLSGSALATLVGGHSFRHKPVTGSPRRIVSPGT